MRLTVLGGGGAWPTPEQGCSGYLVEHEGFTVLIDPGYATVPRLMEHIAPERVDAVLLSHGHPDHCADLNPLLRARALTGAPTPLPVHCPFGAADAVLALDEPGMLDAARTVHEFDLGHRFGLGPFTARTRPLPHFVPNAGIRLTAAGRSLAYTGDCGPDSGVVTLAEGATVLLAEATYPAQVPARHAGYLSSARDAAVQAAASGARRLILTHFWPGIDRAEALSQARQIFKGPVSAARPGLVVDLAEEDGPR